MKYNLIELQKKLQTILPEKRFLHVLGVAYTAASLGFSVGYEDVDLLIVAGLLHDCAKCIPDDEQLRLCEEYKLPITEVERRNPFLLHSKLGAYLAKHEYGISDKKILDAIENHCTGKPAMSLEEKIIFLSDFIEPSRNFPISLHSLGMIREHAYRNLDFALKLTLESLLDYFSIRGSETDIKTAEAYEYYKNL